MKQSGGRLRHHLETITDRSVRDFDDGQLIIAQFRYGLNKPSDHIRQNCSTDGGTRIAS